MDIEKLEKKYTVKHYLEINHEFFSTMLVTYLLLLLAEFIWEGSVTNHINTNYFLIIVIISGAVSILTQKDVEKPEKVELTMTDYRYIAILGIAGAFIIWYKIKDIGNLAYLISGVAGALIILLSLLLFEEEDDV